MSDGQEKSDDLIAELAKLMANGAGEPEAKPGPKLVSPAEPQAEAPRPAAPVVRIPGMDAPPAGSTPAGPTSPLPPAPAASTERTANTAPTIRIPGMDQPVAMQPAPRPVVEPPAASGTPATPEAEARSEAPKVRALDFGTLPPAASIRPEPLSNWQDREIPKPVAARPAIASEPVLTPPVATEPRPATPPAATAPPPAANPSAAFTAAPVQVPAKPAEPMAKPKDAAAEESTIVGKPAPDGDGFDFDFGFDSDPPTTAATVEKVAAEAIEASMARVGPEMAATSDDPIADLISAELDAADAEEPAPAPVPVRPPVQPPAIRSFQPAVPASPVPQQQRSVTTNPVRPPVAPPSPAPEPQAKQSVAETDRFGTAPVFGLGGKPATPPPVERDPMDEIESLIGEAVRVELSAPEKPVAPAPRPQAAPVVPPLNTAFAPRRAAIKDTEPQIASAEAAILAAAAAAAGAEPPRLDGNITGGDQTSYKRPKAKPEKKRLLSGGMRQYIGMAVAGTLLLAAGFGLYWVLGMGRGNDAEAPVLTADATPAKEVPPAAPPKDDAQGSVVFNELGGNNAAAPADEQLVSRDDSADTSIADVAETVGGDGNANGAAAAAGDGSESELANRKVRTVTVRPDGTVVSGDDAVAGSEALPVDRPQVPAVPGADVQPSELLAELPNNDAPADPLAATINAAGANPAVDAANVDPNIVAPVPMARPSDRSALGGGSNQRVAAVNAAPVDLTGGDTPAPAAATVSTASGAYVQLSSQPTTADAQSSLRTTQNRLASILNGRSLEIRQVDLGAKGVWYRVVLPVNSFSEATQTCAAFKASGTDCLPING